MVTRCGKRRSHQAHPPSFLPIVLKNSGLLLTMGSSRRYFWPLRMLRPDSDEYVRSLMDAGDERRLSGSAS